MAEELIDKYVDRNGVEGDTRFMLDKLNEIYNSFKRLNEVKITLGGASGLASTIPVMKQAEEEMKKISQASQELVVVHKKAEDAQRKVDKAVAEGRVEKQKYNQELKREIELQNANNGSIDQARALIKNLTAERNKLNLTTEEGRRQQAALNVEIDKANEFIRANSDALAKQKINIGNYEGSAKIIVDALERARLKVNQTTKDFGKLSPEAQAARGEFEALERITSQPQFLNISAKFGDTNKELRFFTQRLNEMEDAGLKNSQVYNEVKQRLAQLTDQLQDTRQEIKALSSDTRGLDLFAGSVNFAADAMQTAAGAATLFGASEEDAAKATQTLVAVMSVSNGIKGIANELTTKGTAANKAYAFVQGLVSTSLDKTAAAGTRAKAALGLLGIAATVVGALVVAYAAWSRSATAAEIKQQNLNDVMKEAGSEYAKAVEQVNQFKINIDLARQGALDKKAVLKEYNETLGKTTGQAKSLNEAEQLITKNGPAYIQMMYAKATATAAVAKASQLAIEGNVTLENDINKELADLKKNSILGYVIPQSELDKAAKKELNLKKISINKQIKDLLEFAETKQKEAAEIQKKLGTVSDTKDTNTKKDVDDAKKRAEEIKKAEFDAEVQTITKLLEERKNYYKELSEDETKNVYERLSLLRMSKSAEEELINFRYAVEIITGEKTAKQIEELEKQKLIELRELQRRFSTDRVAMKKAEVDKIIAEEERLRTALEKGIDDRFQRDMKRSKELTDKNTEEAQKDLKNTEEYINKKKELFKSLQQELFDLTFTLFTASLERQKNELQEQINALDEKKAKEIELANQAITNEKDKAAAIAVIEAKANVQKEALQRRQKELDIKKAQFDKAQSISRIIQETALNVVKFFGNPVLASLAAAIGAAQIAAVIAQPIPRYKHGKNVNDLYEGPAIVGDGGRPEAIIRENGQVEITGSKPELTYVKRRDIVLPDAAKIADYVVNGQLATKIKPSVSTNTENILEKAVTRMERNVVSAIKNKKELNLSASEGGLAAMWNYGANQVKYINENTNW